MPKIINLHLENWSLLIATCDEQEQIDRDDQMDRLDLSQIEDLINYEPSFYQSAL